jgi:hypothetical protein
MPRKKLKMFVARTVAEARTLVLEKEDLPSIRKDILDEPQEISEPAAFICWGGG